MRSFQLLCCVFALLSHIILAHVVPKRQGLNAESAERTLQDSVNETHLLLPGSSIRLIPLEADTAKVSQFNAKPGALVQYQAPQGTGFPIETRRASAVFAFITKAVLDDQSIGSAAYTGRTPPGWGAIIAQGGTPNRGHLLGKQLGGSGRDIRNIVAMHRDLNFPKMFAWENRVRNVFKNGNIGVDCLIVYEVFAIYSSNAARRHPTAIRMRGLIQDRGRLQSHSWFDVNLTNERVSVETVSLNRNLGRIDCLP